MPLETVERVLNSDAFWLAAFEPSAPFMEVYLNSFRRGIIEGNISALDFNWEAVYYLRDDALWPVIRRMVQIAVEHPEASFLESLSHFLGMEKQKPRLLSAISGVDQTALAECRTLLISLQEKLVHQGDEHLLPGFSVLGSLLEGS